MAKTPTRAKREPVPGARFLSQALADNIRAYRMLRRMNQDNLAERMRLLQHEWSRPTVSEVERGGRNVTVDELGGLALALGVTIGQLLDPTGPDNSRRDGLDVGERDPGTERSGWFLSAWVAHAWVRDRLAVNYFAGNIFDFSAEPAPALHPRGQAAVDAARDGEGRLR